MPEDKKTETADAQPEPALSDIDLDQVFGGLNPQPLPPAPPPGPDKTYS